MKLKQNTINWQQTLLEKKINRKNQKKLSKNCLISTVLVSSNVNLIIEMVPQAKMIKTYG